MRKVASKSLILGPSIFLRTVAIIYILKYSMGKIFQEAIFLEVINWGATFNGTIHRTPSFMVITLNNRVERGSYFISSFVDLVDTRIFLRSVIIFNCDITI